MSNKPRGIKKPKPQLLDADGRPVLHSDKGHDLCHGGVQRIAKEMAGKFYDKAAHDDFFYKKNPSEREFINNNWKGFVKAARETLADMLTKPYPEEVKEQIADMLMLDRTLPGSQSRAIH